MKSTVEPAAILNCEKLRMALLLVRMLVTFPFWETEAVPLATLLSCTAAPALGARAAAMGATAHRTMRMARRRRSTRLVVAIEAPIRLIDALIRRLMKFTTHLNKETLQPG